MASKNISFDQIPASIRKPGKYFEFNTRLAVRTLPANLQRVLIVGQKTSAGSVAELVPTRIFSSDEAAVYFGAGSMAHRMALSAIKANPYLDLSICALDDAHTSVAAAGSITIAGPATTAGALTVNIDGTVIDIAIADDATAIAIATVLETALDTYPDIPVTYVRTDAAIAFTAKVAGTAGNAIIISKNVTAAGVTATIVAMANGASTGTGTAAAGAVTIAGAATGSGSLKLYIGKDLVEIGITADDTAIEIATALKTQIDEYPELSVSASRTDAVLTITAQNTGICGNQLDLAATVTAAGVTATVAAMAGGFVDPDLQSALTKVVPEQYDIIVVPFNNETDLGELADHLDLVSGPMEQRPGIGIFGFDGAIADAITLCTTVNHGRMLGAYLRGTRSPQYEVAAAMGAVIAFEEDPARPLNTLELKGIHTPAIENRLSRTEQEALLHAGVTPLEVGPGENVQIVRAISTYVVDAQGVADVSLLDITTIRTLDYVRKACRERISLRFPREKLSSKTPAKVKTQLLDVLLKLEELEIVENVMENKDGLIVERDEQDVNRLDAKIPADIVNGLHVFAWRIDLLL